MDLRGISDSIASSTEAATACPACGAEVRVKDGLCLNCLLLEGLARPEDTETENFDAVLAEIEIRDSDWRLGNYQILEEIGRGGMGVIYRARQRHSRRIVALKRVLSYHGDSRETLERFRREAQAVASLDHPNILPIYEVGESEGLPFFTMKFAPGGSLQQVAPALRGNPRECVRLLAKITRAVAYAHSEGIFHRDLKPGNILLDGRGEPLVTDFGLAKWTDTSNQLTRSLAIFGTPGFIAPEQANGPGAVPGPGADIYSLGAILFDLLAGRPPFLGEHALAVIRQAADKAAPRLRSIVRGLDRDLETICSRCLEREPGARYRSADELADDLERWLEGRSILARPVSPPVQLWRWSRRNPTLAAALAACLLLAAAAAGWQLQNRGLEARMRAEAIAQHSIAVIPFVDLDLVTPDSETAKAVAEALQSQMSAFGLARAVAALDPSPDWTGIGTSSEVRTVAQKSGSRAILAGTVRRVGERLRISLHLTAQNGSDVLGTWFVEVADKQSIPPALLAADVSRRIYDAVGSHSKFGEEAQPDPAMTNPTAREYLQAGQLVLDRRTIADMDRAIMCFEGALRAEPRSVTVRLYLMMAYIGRDMLSSSPQLAKRAYQVARESAEMAPLNPSVNRGLCFANAVQGRTADAIEFGMRAIELGDRTGRALGQIACSWRWLGRPDKAMHWYEKAKRGQRPTGDYESLMGDCLADVGLNAEAEQAYERATQFRPDIVDGRNGRCRLKLLNGEVELARAISTSALAAYPASPSARRMKAQVEFFARDYAAAERLYADLAEQDPDGGGKVGFYGAVDYNSALARIYRERGDLEASDALLEKGIASARARLVNAPDNAESLYCLAAAEAVRGETQACVKYLEASVQAGWLDYRSLQRDPRFDAVSGTPEFKNIVSGVVAQVSKLKQQFPGGGYTQGGLP